VQVGRGRELAGAKRSEQRRSERGVEHRGQEAALDHADGVQSLLENPGGGWVSSGALAARQRVMTMIMAW
jgi:hypothetical protein